MSEHAEGPPAELSYLALVERNNELLARLVDALAGFDIPEEMRPLHNGWLWVSDRAPSRSHTWPGLQIRAEAGPAGVTVRLVGGDGMIWRQVVWSYDGVPIPPR